MTVLKPEDLFERLRGGRVLVTGNSRLARVLTARYGEWRMARGDRQWASPPIRSWDAWISDWWDDAVLQSAVAAAGAVPGRQQLLALWEDVVQDDPAASALVSPASLAAELADTRSLVVEWRIETGHPAWFASSGNENCAAFRRWNRAFEEQCAARGWLPPEDRLPALVEALSAGKLAPPGGIDLAGFDEFSPLQAELLAAMEAAGTALQVVSLPPAEGRAVYWKASDPADECERMARWVRLHHERDPKARIGVVVPDLAARRAEVRRWLAAVLTPGCEDAGTAPWNLSLGVPLAGVPSIAAAFDLLALVAPRVDIQVAGRVLRSPWIRGGRGERASRALLEKYLREEYPRQFRPDELRYRAGEKTRRRHGRDGAAEEANPRYSPVMEDIARRLVRFEHEAVPRRPSAWAEAIDRLLGEVGWPHGDGGLDAERDRDWQAYQAWQDALRVLSSLDATTEEDLGYAEALQRLRRIGRETVFQPRTPAAPIQVLGLYEVVGLRFDNLWVLGLDDSNWPPPARPNPFIPAILQIAADLPHSGPQRELKVARTVTRRLLRSAPDVVFSYPGQVGGEDRLPSPLLRDCAPAAEAPPGWAGESWRMLIHRAGGAVHEPVSPPLPLAGETAQGGTSILRNQAACPFRAFAVNRLGAEGLAEPADGITPSQHGSLVHRVLEEFWRETRSLDALLALDEAALLERLDRHVETVLADRRDLSSRPAFRRVEAGRIRQLALEYLELEKQRAPFEAEGFEAELEYEIEGQRIRLVIDRIDRLPNGARVIIDYKTGKVKPDTWFGDPPAEPQLPLYAVSAGQAPAAVVYAVLREDGCEFKGIVREPGLFPNLPRPGNAYAYLDEAGRDLPGTTARWREQLHGLMARFLEGQADIQPTDGRKTCKAVYCELQPLCRIGELESLRNESGGAA